MGETEITAEKESSLFKKFIVNHAYNFLKKNCREGDKALAIPRSKLLKVLLDFGEKTVVEEVVATNEIGAMS
ncbi:hypothetical protein ARALYDRAFT_916235 [Arabidopsis lyrata subsp. lyrata]|uniref:Uncharacterized protein n=1 Tax=Arabidopsis lyrata subsp. lyrata TaxID=81972 RepID=D7MJA1_ARALL|nr:hypothetical protein ARALYDRAFT_916235 [Arabidopsis lyrata subsp. lyrata]